MGPSKMADSIALLFFVTSKSAMYLFSCIGVCNNITFFAIFVMALSTWLGEIEYQNLIDIDINQVIENNASESVTSNADQVENNDIDYFDIYTKVIYVM